MNSSDRTWTAATSRAQHPRSPLPGPWNRAHSHALVVARRVGAFQAQVRTRAKSAVTIGGVVVLGMTLCGCSFTNPIGTGMKDSSSNGVHESSGNVRLQNILIVGESAEEPGRVLGTIINDGNKDLMLEITVAGEAERMLVRGRNSVRLESAGPLIFERAGADAGSVVPMTVTHAGGSFTVLVPVLDDSLPYYAPYMP